ncbi:hypothetical protein GF420_07905 [candidate division GN15 bacterium]|nr:hypothetical protein [candidate division GN15 bacterium]
MRAVVVCLTALALALACHDLPTEPDPIEDVTLKTVGTHFTEGERIPRVLSNGSSQDYGHPDCCGTIWTILQRKGDYGWEYFEGSYFGCIAMCDWRALIEAGTIRHDSISAWYTGTFRFELGLSYRPDSTAPWQHDTIYSNAFVVE